MPQDTIVTDATQFEIVDPLDAAPPGSDIGGYVEEGVTQLALGQQVVNVTFQTAKVSIGYQFDEKIVENTVDVSPQVIGFILSNRTLAGFQIVLESKPDTGNYYFRWKVRIPTAIQSGITVTATVAGIVEGTVKEVFATGNDGITASVTNANTMPNIELGIADGSITLDKLAETVVTGEVLTPNNDKTVTNKSIDGNQNTITNIGLGSINGPGILGQTMSDPNRFANLRWDNTAKDFYFEGTPAVRGLTKEVWLAIRTDSKVGSGTSEDPFDCSGDTTAGIGTKFDVVMNGYYQQGPQNITFHLGPGVFKKDVTLYATDGHSPYNSADINGVPRAPHMWFVQSGWNIAGAGIDVTTIQAVGDFTFWFTTGAGRGAPVLAGGGYNNYGGPWIPASDNITVKDLTIDCNYAGVANTIPVGTAYRTFITTSSMPNAYTLVSTNKSNAQPFTIDDVGRVVTGTNVPANTYIGKVVDGNTLELSTTPAANTHPTLSPLVASGTTVSIKNKEFALAAISIGGSNNLIQRVRATNAHGSAADLHELFVILLTARYNSSGTNNWVMDCVVDNCLGDYDDPFVMFGNTVGFGSSGRLTHSGFRRCRAVGKNWAGKGTNINFGISFADYTEISECAAVGGGYGVYVDTGDIWYQDIRNCKFEDMAVGVNLVALFNTSVNGPSAHINILNNTMRCRLGGALVSTSVAVPTATWSHITVDNNDIIIGQGSASQGWGSCVSTGDYTDHWKITRNRFGSYDDGGAFNPNGVNVGSNCNHIIVEKNTGILYTGINVVSRPINQLTDLMVAGNVLDCSWAGMAFYSGATVAAIIDSNWFRGMAGYGINFSSTNGHTVTSNIIDSSTTFQNQGTGYVMRRNRKSDGTVIGTETPLVAGEMGATTTGKNLLLCANPSANSIPVITSANAVATVALSASQSVRRNSANSAFEAFTPASASGSLATDPLWDAKGDIVVATAANTAEKFSTIGTDGTAIISDSAQTTGLIMGYPDAMSVFNTLDNIQSIVVDITGGVNSILTFNNFTGVTFATGKAALFRTGLGVNASVPATAGASGVAGQFAYDATHFYVCISTNTWCRATIATW